LPARNPDHQRAAAKVAILARWRAADDPDLLQARHALAAARAEARLADAAEALTTAGAQLRTMRLGGSR
jgi:hypothetical protein